MKNKIIKISVLMLLGLNGLAQNPRSGIYKTFPDYKLDLLSYEIDCKTEKEKISLNEFLNESYITIKHNGVKTKLKKDSIYAILNCDGPLIRFQNKEHFSLMEIGQVWVYYKEINIPSGKGFASQNQCYFSTGGESKIIELSVSNIKAEFPNNHILHDMLDAQIKSNEDICSYDSFHKMHKINHIIKASSNNGLCPDYPDFAGKEGDKCQKCGLIMEKPKKEVK